MSVSTPGHRGSTPIADPTATYTERCAAFGAERDRYGRQSARMANVSLALFSAVIVLIGIGVWQGGRLWYLLAALSAVAFAASYAFHTAVDKRFQRFQELWAINDEGLRRIARDWDALPLREPPPPADMALAADLDLVGRASLMHLLNTAYTPIGQATLQRWLLEPAAPETIRARQAAVGELAGAIDIRDELGRRGRRMGAAQATFEQFLSWAEGPRWLEHRAWLVWLSRALTVITLGLALASAVGLLATPLWIVMVAINLVVVLTIGGHVDAQIDQVAARQGVFRTYAELFAVMHEPRWSAAELQRIQTELDVDGHTARDRMRRLTRIIALADFRYFMFYLPIQLLTLWNFHVLWLLERWQRVSGPHARQWLTAVGEMEALGALAALRHDQPGWAFPEIVADGRPRVAALQLGHPLLPPTSRVDNDVVVGPPGTFLLVTGSNMSGKSTLLRAIGLNVVLAQAGGPVCAATMQLPPLTLATSMRVQDSLREGVSYFMAEIQRLKAVVDLAETTAAAGERTLLYLLDEILHGTNTGERQIAARQIIRHLVASGALGAVSTHDLALGDAPELARAGQPVHFTEHFTRGPDGPAMSFDYRLRRGIATSTNALKLMELIGLPLDAEVTAP